MGRPGGFGAVHEEGLEPPWVSPPEPKGAARPAKRNDSRYLEGAESPEKRRSCGWFRGSGETAARLGLGVQ